MIDIKEIKKIEELLRKNDVYIASSIEGKGCHLGRFKGFALDADNSLIIKTDIDALSCTIEKVETTSNCNKLVIYEPEASVDDIEI